jgi:peptide/nickel transport system substrate-binding protein/oligopeptide transport system substrate-binding protein
MRYMKYRLMAILRIVLALVIAMSLLTCTSRNREPGYAYFRLEANPTTLDPALIVDVDGGAIAAKLFNGLVRLGDDMGIAPDIALSWVVSENALRYLFNLRSGVRFSSGRKVTAIDFKYSFERVLDPETRSPNTWIFDKVLGAREYMDGEADEVEGIRVVDDHTIEIRLSKPFSPFLGLLTMPAAYVVPLEEVLHQGKDFSSHPVGTGPYKLSEWLPNRHLRLERSLDYFSEPAKVPGIVYRVIPEELTAVTEFEIGNLDVLTIPTSAFERYMGSKKWKNLVSSIKGTNTYYIGLNSERPPFNDPELRRAMNYAIDRARILDTLYEGKGRLSSGPVPDILRQWQAPEGYAYDPDKAREIISANKSLKDRRIKFFIAAGYQISVDIAEVAQSYLADVGLKVEIQQLEWSAFKEAVNNGEADMFWLSWWADYPDPENFLFPLFHSKNIGPAGNRARYKNPEIDKLIELGQHAPDLEQRNKWYSEAEEMIVSDAPWVFFWHRTDYVVRQPWVEDYKIFPVYSMEKGLEISLKGNI